MARVPLIREDMPLLGKSAELVTRSVEQALQVPGTVKMLIDARENVMRLWRVATPEEVAERTTPLHDKLRTIALEEILVEGGESPLTQLFRMFEMVDDAGCFPVFLVSGRGPLELRKWIPFSRRAQSLFGAELMFDSRLTDDVVILCGARVRDAEIDDIEYGVKVTLP